jgi:anhydro-N-acetylmuramic acid kinase
MKSMRVAGIMSGTSLDGIDVAIVDINAESVKTVAYHTIPYPLPVRARILAVSNAHCYTAEISQLNFELGELYAKAVAETCRAHKVRLESIELIGSHGQTIYHNGHSGRQMFRNTPRHPRRLRFPHTRYRGRRSGRAPGPSGRLHALP